MPVYYEYDDSGNEVAVEYEGERLPAPGSYTLRSDGKWWKKQKVRSEIDYIDVGAGIVSPLDGKLYTNGYAYADHAKAMNRVLIGNDCASEMKARQERIAARAEAARNRN